MSVDSTTIARNSEIIGILCDTGGSTQASLLSQLQSQYASVGWTNALLSSYLSSGLSQGRFKRLTENPTRYGIRSDMVSVYPSNWVYQGLCTQITNYPSCVVTVADTHNEFYDGGDSCGTILS